MGNPFAPDMVRQLKSVADPALAPDGSRVVFTYGWVEEETLESRSRLRMLRLDGGANAPAVEFTQGLRDGSPKFSPDGRTIAFLRPDDAGLRQIWLIPADGGEARQLTNSAGNIIDVAWAPDSGRLAYSADVSPEGKGAASGDSILPQVSVARRIKYRYDGLGWRGDAHFHLFVVNTEDGNISQLTDGDWDDYLPMWSPDGARIAFISSRREDRDITSSSEAYVVSVNGNAALPECWSAELDSVGSLAWSPDGRRLAAAGVASKQWPGPLAKLAVRAGTGQGSPSVDRRQRPPLPGHSRHQRHAAHGLAPRRPHSFPGRSPGRVLPGGGFH